MESSVFFLIIATSILSSVVILYQFSILSNTHVITTEHYNNQTWSITHVIRKTCNNEIGALKLERMAASVDVGHCAD